MSTDKGCQRPRFTVTLAFGMIWTLHLYLLRQLLRTFVFASIALVMLFVLGGGMANLVRGSGQLWATVQIVLPIAFTLMTPVALLLSTTMTFGRLSADNEIDACRASGINLYQLFLVPVVLSILATGFVGIGVCHWIPSYLGQFTNLFTQNAQTLMRNQLMFTGSMRVGDFSFYTDEINDDPKNPNRLLLDRPAFLEVDKQGEVVRYGSALQAEIRFDTDRTRPTAGMDLHEVRVFDLTRRQWAESAFQPFGPYELPTLISNQVKWLPLLQLFTIWGNPLPYEYVANRHEQLLTALTTVLAYREALARLDCGQDFVMSTGKIRYTVRAKKATQTGEDHPISLSDLRVEATGADNKTTVFTAPLGMLNIEYFNQQRGLRWTLTLKAVRDGAKVLLFSPTALGPSRTQGYPHDKYALEPCPLDAALRTKAEAIPVQSLLDGAPHISPKIKPKQALSDPTLMTGPVVQMYGPQVGLSAATLRNVITDTNQQILAEVNYRLSYSLSTLILIPLGVCLGIIFRGAHVLTAFALSGLPGLLVILGIILGRNYISLQGYFMGVTLIWAGNIICAVVLLYVLGRVLRR